MHKFILLTLIASSSLCLKAQNFKKLSLTKQDRQKGILHIYSGGNFEVFNQLTLFKDERFYYQYKHLGYDIFSKGNWIQKDDSFILNSDLDSNDVPVKFVFSILILLGLIMTDQLTKTLFRQLTRQSFKYQQI